MGDLAVHGHEVYPSDIPSLGFPSGIPPVARTGRRAAARRLRGRRRTLASPTPTLRQADREEPDGHEDHRLLRRHRQRPRRARARAACSPAPAATLELAYVRHAHEAESGRERLAEHEAEALLEAGATALGARRLPRHVVLSALDAGRPARARGARAAPTLIVFGSEYRTAPGHVDPQASARRLLDGGPVALALAPAGFAERGDFAIAHDRARSARTATRARSRRQRRSRRDLGGTVADARRTATSTCSSSARSPGRSRAGSRSARPPST